MSLCENKVVNSKAEYAAMVSRIRQAATQRVDPRATILVVSKGDPELMRLEGRRTWHFPQAADGEYAGFYPADSATAIEHLEGLRTQGARYFLLPATSFWWLDHYVDFAQHLDQSYHCLSDPDDEFRLYRLDSPAQGLAPARARPRLRQSSAHVQLPTALGRQLQSVLDALTEPHERIWVCDPGRRGPTSIGGRALEPVDVETVLAWRRDTADPALETEGGVLVLLHNVEACPGLLRSVQRAAVLRWRRLAHREHLCSLYRLDHDF